MSLQRRDLIIVERYSMLGQPRYRIQVAGTNIVFNVSAETDEEAIEKALVLAEKIGLSKSVVEAIKQHIKEH